MSRSASSAGCSSSSIDGRRRSALVGCSSAGSTCCSPGASTTTRATCSAPGGGSRSSALRVADRTRSALGALPDDRSADANVWVFANGRVLEQPAAVARDRARRASLAGGPAASSTSRRATRGCTQRPCSIGGRRIGTVVVAGVRSHRTSRRARSRCSGRSIFGGMLVLLVVGLAARWLLASLASPGAPHDAAGRRLERARRRPALRARRAARRADRARRDARLPARPARREPAPRAALLRRALARAAHADRARPRGIRAGAAPRASEPQRVPAGARDLHRDSASSSRGSSTRSSPPRGTRRAARAEPPTRTPSPRAPRPAAASLRRAASSSRSSTPAAPLRLGLDADLAERILQPVLENACRYGVDAMCASRSSARTPRSLHRRRTTERASPTTSGSASSSPACAAALGEPAATNGAGLGPRARPPARPQRAGRRGRRAGRRRLLPDLAAHGMSAWEPRAGATAPPVSLSVLVVDDDAPIRRMLERTLAAEGYGVSARGGRRRRARRRSSARCRICSCSTSALPGLDGLAVCRRLRGKGLALPILLLTARDGVADRVDRARRGRRRLPRQAVRAGGAAGPRARPAAPRRACRARCSAYGDLVFDVETRSARRAARRDRSCSAREADLLELLLRNPRQVVSREQALERVWGGVAAASPNVVDRYVSYLRRKLGDAAADPDRARRRLRARAVMPRSLRRPLDRRGVARDPARARRRRRRRRRPRRPASAPLARPVAAPARRRGGAAERLGARRC